MWPADGRVNCPAIFSVTRCPTAASLPDEQKVAEQHGKAINASMGLLSHLWDTGGKDAEATAWRIPLLATDGATYKASRRRTMILPVSTWPEAARKFASAYPPGRVLDERYAAAGEQMLAALTEWGVGYPGLIVMIEWDEIPERGLKPIAAEPEQVTGATLHETTLSQIALLEPELINYCRQTRERARALFGLVVCYVASADASWRATAELAVKTKEGEKTVALTPSLWLSDLRSKPWIPVDEDGSVVHYPATAALVRDLLDAEWLHGNPDGGTLLVQHFGLDALDVGLLAAATRPTFMRSNGRPAQFGHSAGCCRGPKFRLEKRSHLLRTPRGATFLFEMSPPFVTR